jgi:hypothetical protein
VENPTTAEVIPVEPACADNPIPLDYLTSDVPHEEHEIANTDRNIPIDNNCTDENLHCWMPGGSGDYEDEGDKSGKCDAIPTASV